MSDFINICPVGAQSFQADAPKNSRKLNYL